MPWAPDPSNRVSGRVEAIELGRRVFFDTRFSANRQVACVTCHLPERAFADGREQAVGIVPVDRNTPGLLNVRLNRWFGWDGAGDSLWSQSVRPFLDPREMGGSDRLVADTVRSDPDLSACYRAAFGAPPGASDEVVLVDVAKALAAYQETFTSGRTAFDAFRDALAKGDWRTASRYPAAAQRGAKLFVGKGNCALCHFGPNFTNGEFHDIGIPLLTRDRRFDWGRYQGIKHMQASRFNLLGRYNDDPKRGTVVSTRHVVLAAQSYGEFKVPSLRNAARTAPYMHNGSIATLADVVRHYSGIDPSRLHQGPHLTEGDGTAVQPQVEGVLKALNLSDGDVTDLVAFIETLSPTGAPARDPRARAGIECR
jgi:cytochrome c peroxidase